MKGKRITKKDGNEYMDIPQMSIKMVPNRMEMQLDNLFNGDQQLGMLKEIVHRQPHRQSGAANKFGFYLLKFETHYTVLRPFLFQAKP